MIILSFLLSLASLVIVEPFQFLSEIYAPPAPPPKLLILHKSL